MTRPYAECPNYASIRIFNNFFNSANFTSICTYRYRICWSMPCTIHLLTQNCRIPCPKMKLPWPLFCVTMQLFTLTSPELPDREMANQNSVYDIDTDWLYIFPNSYWKVGCFGVNPSEKNWKRNWREGKTQLSIFKIAPSYIGSLICC